MLNGNKSDSKRKMLCFHRQLKYSLNEWKEYDVEEEENRGQWMNKTNNVFLSFVGSTVYYICMYVCVYTHR